MITVNGKELRNLEEQVQYNSDRIVAIIEGNEVLAEMGIKVVGQVSEAALLPDAATYTGDYGDAYLVGVTPPYEYYIYTRPFSGQTTPQWFLLGLFPVPGPQGPQGTVGPQGPKGDATKWHTGSSVPTLTAPAGDMYIRFTAVNNPTNGAVYISAGDGVWQPIGTIRGPQGVQGPEGPQGIQGPAGESITGPQGPAGQFITIKGELANIDQLPDPTTVGRESAYLIPIDDINHVFVISGEEGSLQWLDAGSFGQGGSKITVGGVYQQNWNADTKLNVATESSGNRLYCKFGAENSTINFAQAASSQVIVQRTSTAQINLPNQTNVAPTDDQAISKRYADTHFAKKADCVPVISNMEYSVTRVYGARAQEKGPELIGATSTPISPTSGLLRTNYLVMLDGTAHFEVLDPTADNHPANKKYVDDIVVETHKVLGRPNGEDTDEMQIYPVPSNMHCKIVVPGGTATFARSDDGSQIDSINAGPIPSFSTADIAYGDDGVGYATISNTTYIFYVPENGVFIYTNREYFQITHV